MYCTIGDTRLLWSGRSYPLSLSSRKDKSDIGKDLCVVVEVVRHFIVCPQDCGYTDHHLLYRSPVNKCTRFLYPPIDQVHYALTSINPGNEDNMYCVDG